MLERGALLTGKFQPALRCVRQRALPVCIRHVMPIAFGHRFSGAAQALLGLDHIATGKSVLSAPVLAESNQLGRCAYRSHDCVILLAAIAMALRDPDRKSTRLDSRH